MPPKKPTGAGSAGRGRAPAGRKSAAAPKTGAGAGRGKATGRGGRQAAAGRASTNNNAARGVVQVDSDDAMETNGAEDEEAEEAEVGGNEEEEESGEDEDEDEDEEPPKTIPPELLTRMLHEFFERDGTRITRDANDAVARYVDVFVREAIARAAVEREGGFFEVSSLLFFPTYPSNIGANGWDSFTLQVEDLEKIAPQLLLDL